jgi:hypothetical protein
LSPVDRFAQPEDWRVCDPGNATAGTLS